MPNVNPAARLAALIGDPLRYAVLERLVAGPATVSELVALTGASQPAVSNHLALMRDGGLVAVRRIGRHAVYALANAAVAGAIEAIESAAGGGSAVARATPEIAVARSCYDHLAGKLGTALFRALVVRGALRDVAPARAARKVRDGLGAVALGPRAEAVFGALAIDLEAVAAERRRFASACNDWTESAPHLGGALGAAVFERLLRSRWLLRKPGTRTLRITPAGRDAFRAEFGIDVAPGGAVEPGS